jgi:hypothetical protein
MSPDNALTFPPIGSPWHTRDGRNVFVSDVSLERNGETTITLVTEYGRSLQATRADLGTIFLKGYRR